MSELADYHYPKVYKQLLGFVEKHEMKIFHEYGLYRHLRFKSPGTGIGYFDLVTWPGSLAIRGDIGEGFIFTREQDMIPWFHTDAPGHINPQYWSEKLDRGTREVRRVFSEEKFETYLKSQVEEFAATHGQDLEEVREHVELEGQLEHVGDNEQRPLIHGQPQLRRQAYWDESLIDSVGPGSSCDHHFLLACHAILWGVEITASEKLCGAVLLRSPRNSLARRNCGHRMSEATTSQHVIVASLAGEYRFRS